MRCPDVSRSADRPRGDQLLEGGLAVLRALHQSSRHRGTGLDLGQKWAKFIGGRLHMSNDAKNERNLRSVLK